MKEKSRNTAVGDFLLNTRYRVYRHLLLQLIMVLITVNVFWYEPLQSLSFVGRLFGWIIYLVMMEFVIYSNHFLLIPRFLLKNRLGLYLLTALGVILIMIGMTYVLQKLLYAPVLSELYPERLFLLINAFSGVFTIGFVTAGMAAIMLFRHWIFHNQRIDELQSATLHTELKYLKNKANPQFLFNMLKNVQGLIQNNPAEASEVLFKLEDLLRYQINGSSRGQESLRSGIDFLNAYLSLEKLRRSRFEYTLVVEGEVDAVQTPPHLFFPFVENATKHSFDPVNPSYVHLTFVVADKQLDFRCENSKPPVGIGKESLIGGRGLAHIRHRLALLYPGRYLLGREETKQNYTVTLYLNL